MILHMVIEYSQALFVGVAGILMLVRAGGAGRARGLVVTAGALACLYALWSAIMQVLWRSVPPVPGTVPGVDDPELTPMQAFMDSVLQPAWRYGSWPLICAIALLLVIALARSGAATAKTARYHGHQGPPGPPGPHGQVGPHGQRGPSGQPPHPGQQPPWDQPYGAQYQQAHHRALGHSGPQHPPAPLGPPAPPPPAPPEQQTHQQPVEAQWPQEPDPGQPPQAPPRRRPGRHRAPDPSQNPDPPGRPDVH